MDFAVLHFRLGFDLALALELRYFRWSLGAVPGAGCYWIAHLRSVRVQQQGGGADVPSG